MNEGIPGTASAEFLPGTYSVRGDTVFAGQVTVTATGPNDLVIPSSAALSPAGPGPEPVSVTATGSYIRPFRQWTATPLPDGETLRSDGERGAPWAVMLMPGQWLLTAIASGTDGEGLAAVIDIGSAGAIEVGQPTFDIGPFTDLHLFTGNAWARCPAPIMMRSRACG
jgi:Ca-activated chloride channel homolog